jgi:hypothetical protein
LIARKLFASHVLEQRPHAWPLEEISLNSSSIERKPSSIKKIPIIDPKIAIFDAKAIVG